MSRRVVRQTDALVCNQAWSITTASWFVTVKITLSLSLSFLFGLKTPINFRNTNEGWPFWLALKHRYFLVGLLRQLGERVIAMDQDTTASVAAYPAFSLLRSLPGERNQIRILIRDGSPFSIWDLGFPDFCNSFWVNVRVGVVVARCLVCVGFGFQCAVHYISDHWWILLFLFEPSR